MDADAKLFAVVIERLSEEDRKRLAVEFEINVSTINRWARASTCPHPLLQEKAKRWIAANVQPDFAREQLQILVNRLSGELGQGDYDHGPCSSSYRTGRWEGAEEALKAYDEAKRLERIVKSAKPG